MLTTYIKGFIFLDPNTLIINEEINAIYGNPSNYNDIKDHIQSFGIIQPIVVNKSTLQVISGNLRLKIALELKYTLVPVVFCDLDINKFLELAVSSNLYREKSLMDRYNEMKFIESYFNVTQGSRTDLDPQLFEESILKKKLLLVIPTYTRNKIVRAKKLLQELNIEIFEEQLVKDIQRIDEGVLSLNAYVKELELEVEKKHMKLNVPEFYEINRAGFTLYNNDSYSKPDIPDKSIATIICSPPYRGMRVYGKDSYELGAEKTKEEYIGNLVRHFNECHRLLKDNGSLFVNINEGVQENGYEGSVHLFIIEMLRTSLWTLNDEIIWAKTNPVYTAGNRFVRSHEYVLHFVKSNNKGFKYNTGIYPFIRDEKGLCVYGADKLHPKILSFFELRENTFLTNVANTGSLRKLCKRQGLPMEHTATFPLSVPALLILLTTNEGDTIMDIFNGTGVTGEACIFLGRNYIGFEKYASYVKATEVRINNMAA
jgi:DNA modification methylase/ParB-like chromosome segregation protein Spo0J